MFKQLSIAIGIVLISSSATFGYNHYFSKSNENGQRESRPQAVKAEKPSRKSVKDTIQSIGSVAASEKIDIAPEIGGYIDRIFVKNGDRVSKGDKILSIDNAKVMTELESKKTSLGDAQLKRDRIAALFEKKLVSESEMSDAQTALDIAEANVRIAQENLAEHLIVAPMDGVISIDELSRGQYLSAGQSVGQLKNQDVVNVRFFIPQNSANTADLGQEVIVTSGANERYSTEGVVVDLATSINTDNRMLRVKAKVENRNNKLFIGESVEVSLVLGEREALIVNEESLLMKGSNRYVFVISESTANRVAVETGVRSDGHVEITRGIQPNNLIVVEGQDRLASGDKVTVVEPEDESEQ